MPASMVTEILQGYAAGHLAQYPVHSKVKKDIGAAKKYELPH
jgi:hypothetical protein